MRGLRIGLLVLTLLGAGCGPSESTSDSPTDSALKISGGDPILPEAPWFSIPDDWDEQHPVVSPNAKLETHWLAMAEREVTPAPGDGQGRAEFVAVTPVGDPERGTLVRSDRPVVVAGSRHRFEIRFEVGPHGIAEGGLVFLMPEVFWFWSEAQTADPQAPGYTTVRPPDASVRLVPEAMGAGFRVQGRELEAGEELRFVYGAGPSGARVDRYAERAAEIMLGVDADGDGVRGWIEDGPRVEVVAEPGVHLVARGPADIAPDTPFELILSLTDRYGNRARWPETGAHTNDVPPDAFEVEVTEDSTLGLATGGGQHEVTASSDPPHRISLTPAAGTGTLRLSVRGVGAMAGLVADVPPIRVRDAKRRLVWGDLHGHSQLSDGTGTPEDYFAYAREVARLDVVALTDHDHWGIRPLDERADLTQRLFESADHAHVPGRFVTLPGYEWTSWLHGHRHVLYFETRDDPARPILHSAIDPATDRPDELWRALRGRQALTFAHHSAGDPVAVNWAFEPDPVLEPVTEIASIHGQSESEQTPAAVRGGLPGYFVLDALENGYRLGFIGSGDSHDGHPGLAELASGRSGLAGLFTEGLTRAEILDSLRRRHTFATNGIRPWLSVSIDGAPMGATIIASDPGSKQLLQIEYEGTTPIERVELVRSGRTATLEAPDGRSYHLERSIPALAPGEFHYVRIIEEGGGMAWSSPVFADGDPTP